MLSFGGPQWVELSDRHRNSPWISSCQIFHFHRIMCYRRPSVNSVVITFRFHRWLPWIFSLFGSNIIYHIEGLEKRMTCLSCWFVVTIFNCLRNGNLRAGFLTPTQSSRPLSTSTPSLKVTSKSSPFPFRTSVIRVNHMMWRNSCVLLRVSSCGIWDRVAFS